MFTAVSGALFLGESFSMRQALATSMFFRFIGWTRNSLRALIWFNSRQFNWGNSHCKTRFSVWRTRPHCSYYITIKGFWASPAVPQRCHTFSANASCRVSMFSKPCDLFLNIKLCSAQGCSTRSLGSDGCLCVVLTYAWTLAHYKRETDTCIRAIGKRAHPLHTLAFFSSQCVVFSTIVSVLPPFCETWVLMQTHGIGCSSPARNLSFLRKPNGLLCSWWLDFSVSSRRSVLYFYSLHPSKRLC